MSLIRNLIFFLLTPLLFVSCITANHHLDDDGCSIYYENGVHKIDFGYGEEDYLVRDSADVVFLDSVFSFNILSKNKPLEANKIPLIGLDEYKYKKNSEIVLEKTGKSNQVYYFISDANNEVHGVDINLNEKSFVGVFDRHFYLDSLYNDNLFASHETMEPFIGWTCSDFFDFKFSGQHYILFFVSPIVENSSFVESRGILLNITEKNVHVHPFPYYQYSTSTHCINDFNNDGYLDCALFDSSGILNLHSLIEDNFKPDILHYIRTKSSIGNVSVIDRSKSNWYCNDGKIYHIRYR